MKLKGISILLMLAFGLVTYGQQVFNFTSIEAPPNPGVPYTIYSNYTEPYIFKSQNYIQLNNGFEVQPGFPLSNRYFLAYIAMPPIYGELKRELDASYFPTVAGELSFVYEEKYVPQSPENLKLTVYNNQMTPLVSNVHGSVSSLPTGANRGWAIGKRQGKNYYTFNIMNNPVFNFTDEKSSYFILEIIDEKGGKWYMRFRNIPI